MRIILFLCLVANLLMIAQIMSPKLQAKNILKSSSMEFVLLLLSIQMGMLVFLAGTVSHWITFPT